MSELKNLAAQYFNFFSNKDMNKLDSMFSDDVSLKDWEVEVSGKTGVLNANQNIFNAVQTITVKPIQMIEESKIIVAQLDILINGEQHLNVVDILHFDSENKICRVIAYKC